MQMVQRFRTKLSGSIAWRLVTGIRWAAFVALALCALAVLCGAGRSAHAAAPWESYAGTVPVPLGDSSGRLVSQTIVAAVTEAEDGVWATVDGRFLIEGAGAGVTVSLPVELPGGYVFDPGVLPEFAATVGGQVRALTPLQIIVPDATEPITSAYTLALPVPRDGTVAELGVHYRQYLGDGPVATFRFATAQAARWTGEIGSSRVVVELPQVTNLEQVLAVQPSDVAFDGQRVEWYYSDFEPSVDVVLMLVKPSLWQQVLQARIAVTEAPSSARAHYELALLYRQIAGSGSVADWQESYQDMLMAELSAALQSAESLPAEVSCDIRRDMQAYYLEKTRRADTTVDTAFLLQAVDAFRQAETMCPQDAMPHEVIAQIEEGYIVLAHEARRQGRYEATLGYLESAEVLYREVDGEGGEFLQRVETERHMCFLTWMLDLLRQGDIRSAVVVGERGGIGESALADWDAMPRTSSVQISVQTGAGQRRILISLTPFPSALEGSERPQALQSLVAALAESADGGFTVTLSVSDAGAYLIETAIPFTSGTQLRDAQSTLAAALPDWPELAFARVVLAPTEIDVQQEEAPFSRRESYQETIDSRESASILAEQLQSCERRLQELDGAAGQADDAESVESELRLVRREILTMARSGWERLAGSSRAVFSLSWTSLTGEQIERTWTVDAGRELDMHLGSEMYDWSAIAMAVGLTILGIVVIVLILFLLARVRR